ncbi:MAG: sugar dehydrogenase, partial [Pseudomonadota bacterium]
MNLCAHKIGLLLFSGLAMAAHAATDALVYENQTLVLDGVRVQARVPKGYRLELLTSALDGPRLLTFAPNGDLFIGSKSGKVYRLAPPYTIPQVLVTLDGYPHSVAFRKDEILIARTNGLYRAPYKPGQAKLAPETVT